MILDPWQGRPSRQRERMVGADHLRVGRKKRVRRELEMSIDLQRL